MTVVTGVAGMKGTRANDVLAWLELVLPLPPPLLVCVACV